MCNKAVDTYPSTIKFIPGCVMNQIMYDKEINRFFCVFHSIFNQYETQEMCDSVVSENPFYIVYCNNKYITQRICDQAAFSSSIETCFHLVCDK